MGSTQALGMAESVENGWIELDAALEWHLRCNHYPPLPSSLIPACLQAIEFGNNGEWDALVELPTDVTYKDGNYAPASVCIEAWHLDAFIDYQE